MARKQGWTYHTHREDITLDWGAATWLHLSRLVRSSAVQLCGGMFTSDVRVAAGVAVSTMCRSLLSLPQVADFGLHVLVQQDVGAVRQKRDVDITSFGKESSSTRCQLFHLARWVRLPFTILHPGKKKVLLPRAATLQRVFFFFFFLNHWVIHLWAERTHTLSVTVTLTSINHPVLLQEGPTMSKICKFLHTKLCYSSKGGAVHPVKLQKDDQSLYINSHWYQCKTKLT